MRFDLSAGTVAAGIFDSHHTFSGQTVTKERAVTCFELEFYDEDGGVTYVNDVPCPIRAGYVLRAIPGDRRHSDLPLKTYYVKVTNADGGLAEILRSLPRYAPFPEEADPPAAVRDIMTAAASGDRLSAAARFLQLLAALCSAADRSRRLEQIPQPQSRDAVSRGIAYLDGHFREKCTLEEVAAYAHFSPVYFHGLFCKALGETPYEYLTRLRIDEAKRLLLTQQKPLSQVAEECGFSSQSYFNSVFRRVTGTTPSVFRRAALERYLSEDGKG